MPAPSATAVKILDIAENYIQNRGYHAFSFREIAQAIGIKSASIHYHFPTKPDLAAAVVRRYTQQFIARLGPPNTTNADANTLLKAYVEEFHQVFLSDGDMCLGGILGAEVSSLPIEVSNATRDFFEANLNWLDATLLLQSPNQDKTAIRLRSFKVLAILEGTLLLKRSIDNKIDFDEVVESLLILS